MKNYNEIIMATLRLFKSVYVGTDDRVAQLTTDEMIDLTAKGLLFDPSIGFPSAAVKENTIKAAIDLYGLDLFKLSNTFHKTWQTVDEIDPALHYLQQLIHYISTYGFDSLGIEYDANNTIIPAEKIPYPENVKPYNFTVIHIIGLDELSARVSKLVSTGVALNQQQVDDLVILMDFLQLNGKEVNYNLVANKEVRATLWLKLSKKPYISVDEFLRVLTYKVTGTTLLVRSYRNYQVLKTYLKGGLRVSNTTKLQEEIKDLLEYYIQEFGMENIASQFLRNKMIFLSLKCDTTKSIINKIRREANKYHRALEEKYLTEADIEVASIWQLVKYYNLCLSNLNPTQDKLYQIRNGRNYLAENKNYGISGEFKRIVDEHYSSLKTLIENKLKEKLASLQGKIFLVPDYLDYKVPSSLKRLASGLPEGSTITFPEGKPFTIGVHWTNFEENGRVSRVDLDLHANSINNQIGWYSNYKNNEVMYSGDVTDAPIEKGGASEALTFNNIEDSYMVTLNNYTQNHKTPYKFVFDLDMLVSSKEYGREARGYIFSPNARALNASVGTDQNSLGLVMKNKFYFLNSSMFSGPITCHDELMERLITYYEESHVNQLSFRQLADMIGFRVISDMKELEVPEGEEVPEVTDLSLESITEDTFPSLFDVTE